MEKFRGKKVLVVGLGKTGFALINLFKQFECQIKVTENSTDASNDTR